MMDPDPLYVDETYRAYRPPTKDELARAPKGGGDCKCADCGHCRKWHIVRCLRCGCKGFI